MPYDNLIYNETLMLEITIIGLLLLFAVAAVMIFISIRDSHRYTPVLRPVSDPEKIEDAVKRIIDTREFYTSNTSFLLETKNAVSDMMSNKRVGLILLQNTGDSPAIDIEFKALGDYYISDGPETKISSITAGDFHSFLFYLPEDMVNDLLLYPVKIRFRNIRGRRLSEQFHVALSPNPKVMIDEETQLRIYLQI